jgi:hypothetical protein
MSLAVWPAPVGYLLLFVGDFEMDADRSARSPRSSALPRESH